MVSGMEPEEMVNLTSNAVQEMINQHQQLPGSVKRVNFKNQFIEETVFSHQAVFDRVSEAAAMVENLTLGNNGQEEKKGQKK